MYYIQLCQKHNRQLDSILWPFHLHLFKAPHIQRCNAALHSHAMRLHIQQELQTWSLSSFLS